MDSETCWTLEGGGCRKDDEAEVHCETGDTAGGEGPAAQGDARLEGTGCSVLGAGPLWAALALVWVRRLLPLLLFLLAPSAWAADAQQVYASAGNFLALDDPELEPWSVGATLSAQALSGPAVLRSGDREQQVIGRMNTGALDLSALIGPVELGVLVPVHMGVQGFGGTLARVPGDVQIRATLPVGNHARWGVTTYAPRGGTAVLLGTPGAVGSEVSIQVDREVVVVHTQLGVLLQQEEELPGMAWGNRVTYGVGVGKQWHDWAASAELVGSGPLPPAGVPGAWPLEALVSLGVPSGRLRIGVGRGVTRGFGSPAWRVALAMSASTGSAQDSDLDGIVDPRDLCRNKPEDRDNYRDEDGCPEADNDSDGFLDAEDDCPNDPEVYNGLSDDDGCPDETSVLRVRVVTDRGELEQVLVEVDGESNALIGGEELDAEVFPGPHSLRVSSEGYRPVALRVDLEPGGTLVEVQLEQLVFGELRVILVGPAEGTLEVEGAELPIAGERRVELPAGPQLVRVHADGWAPAHTVVQVPEGRQVTVTLAPNRLALDLEDNQVVLAEDVHFELDSCEVIPGEGLEALADWLLDTPSVSLLRVEGHADELGGPAYNYGLSLCRADAVVAWLVDQGVDGERLLAVGAGEALAEGPESRRVGFLVLIWNEAIVVDEPPATGAAR